MTNHDVYDIIKDLVNYTEHSCTCIEQFYDFCYDDDKNYDEIKEEFFKILKTALLDK